MKRITRTNWLEPDSSGGTGCQDAQAWIDRFLAIRLDERVPAQIAAMFEAARGGMIYGWFFAPLVAFGVEHCYRLLEAGVRERCAQLGLPVTCSDRQGRAHPLSFAHNLRSLVALGVIARDDLRLWRQAGELRNWATLPEHQDLLGPEHAATALTRAAELLNRLYA